MFRCLYVVVFSFYASAILADPVIYDCEYKNRSNGGWISKRAFYQVDAARKFVAVLDAGVHYANDGKPLITRLQIRRNGVYIFRWNVTLPTKANRDINAGYRVRLDPRSLRVSQSVFVPDDRDHNGAGRCVVKE